MAPLDQQPQTSTPIKTSRQEERKLEVTVEAVEPSRTETEVKVLKFSELLLNLFAVLFQQMSKIGCARKGRRVPPSLVPVQDSSVSSYRLVVILIVANLNCKL